MSTAARDTGGARRTAAVILLVAIGAAGVLSSFASSSPDGLERVAVDTGIGLGRAPAWSASPLPDYTFGGIGGPASTALAGLVGVLACVLVGSWLTRVLQPRTTGTEGGQSPV